jgi:hypothetical protein
MLREYSIYRTLKLLARQRVALVLQPGNVWVIERAIPETERNFENIQTCLMRGWVEVLHQSVLSGKLNPNGTLPPNDKLIQQAIYRLTDGGWNAIHRTHIMAVLGIAISLLGAAIAILGTHP